MPLFWITKKNQNKSRMLLLRPKYVLTPFSSSRRNIAEALINPRAFKLRNAEQNNGEVTERAIAAAGAHMIGAVPDTLEQEGGAVKTAGLASGLLVTRHEVVHRQICLKRNMDREGPQYTPQHHSR